MLTTQNIQKYIKKNIECANPIQQNKFITLSVKCITERKNKEKVINNPTPNIVPCAYA